MRTSLQAISNKARESKKYRFRNLYTMLNRLFLEDSWKYLKRKAAPGVDRVTVRDFERNFADNIGKLVEDLKRKRYRAKLVKRAYIPKTKGKMRPLGLPATIDKLLQVAVKRILEAIYEQVFLPCSYGYRPHVGPANAVKEISRTLQFGPYNYIVEADIKGFYDNISHEWMEKMLEQRVDDKAFIGLIKKWLKAGVLDTDGQVLHPATGTPQGGIVSPVLANIYLHYAIDLWFERVVRKYCRGAVYMCRFADDFVCAFQYKDDAEKFYRTLPKRLDKFGLEIAPDKTKMLKFSRYDRNGKESFVFLGFEFRWAISRKGKGYVKRRTSRKKFKTSLASLTQWCREHRFLKTRIFFKKLNAKLRGYYNYYGVIGNYYSINEFFDRAKSIIFKWLNRRSQRKSMNWDTFKLKLNYHRIATPRITEKREDQFKFSFC